MTLDLQHKKYTAWLSGLKPGDLVEVQQPWDDEVFISGHRSQGVVVGGCGDGGKNILVKYEYGKKFRTCCSRVSGGTGYEQLAPVGVEVRHDWSVGYYLAGEPRKRAIDGSTPAEVSA